jgi:hypothetical protein
VAGFLLALLDNSDTGVFLKMARWTYGDTGVIVSEIN